MPETTPTSSPASPAERPEKIGAEGTEPTGTPARSGNAQYRDIDEQLDAALACTFPASDPIGCLGTDLNCCAKEVAAGG